MGKTTSLVKPGVNLNRRLAIARREVVTYQAQKRRRRRSSSEFRGSGGGGGCAPAKKKRSGSIVSRARKVAILAGKKTCDVFKALRETPPNFKTTLAIGEHEAVFKFQPRGTAEREEQRLKLPWLDYDKFQTPRIIPGQGIYIPYAQQDQQQQLRGQQAAIMAVEAAGSAAPHGTAQKAAQVIEKPPRIARRLDFDDDDEAQFLSMQLVSEEMQEKHRRQKQKHANRHK
ncbi:unnamed protein product [Oikopleura dioica]|uniref:Uncharacterized protein n=1 Tax=Oikopleura dioica TaxID=34765 RepID=E4X2B1_OIKDI|nr:unnamed protein product [Oikopleura dioica]